jgi:[acyl-carrier-protein] S-malonyltransferase
MKVAWLFPGQGAQQVGMGKDVYEASAAARAVYDAADAALGERLSGLCFDGPLDVLTQTANTQPAIVATCSALLAAARERLGEALPAPACAAGHSLGEYSALVAAGALSLPDAVRACRVRGKAMQEAVPEGQGAMAAVMNLEGDAVAEVCAGVSRDGHVVSCANFNADSQTVIAGHRAAVLAASAAAQEKGGKVIPLNVSAPFHCALMAPARAPLSEALGRMTVSAPAFPVLANVDAEPKTDPAAIVAALEQQVDSPVRWVATIRRMRQLGVTHALELGPGRVLAGLARRIDRELAVLSVYNVESIEKIDGFLRE